MKRILPWWNVFPFVRLLVPFVSGIYFQPLVSPFVAGTIAAAGFISPYLLGTTSVYRQFKLRFIIGISFHAVLFAFGSFTAFVHDIRNSPLWFDRHPCEQLIGVSISEPRISKNGYQIDVSIIKRRHRQVWHNATGKIRLRISGVKTPVFNGSILRFRKMPKPVKTKPGSAFDYRAYLANQNIFHQLSLDSSELEVLKTRAAPNGIIVRIRNNILSTLDESFPEKSERALAKALLVGERAELEESLMNAYRDTGVIHVIAISGLHLGLIYGMLIMIFKPLTGKRYGKLLANAFILLALWTFTLICGASASVVRSAVMFTSLLVGDTIGSENNTGNALASSAFLLLCFDPFLINDIGFQLSYAAVASLLLYNRSLASLYHPENSLLAHAWSSISTSISAQILTTPLILVHFHQFPLVFVLSNLVAVPVSGLVLLFLILLCMLQALPLMTLLLAKASSSLIWFMNHQVARIASLPFAAWKNIDCSNADVIFIYLSILFLTLTLRMRSPTALIFFLLTILTWLVSAKYSLL